MWFDSMPAVPDTDYVEYSTTQIEGGNGDLPFVGTWTWHGREYASPACILSAGGGVAPSVTAVSSGTSAQFAGVVTATTAVGGQRIAFIVIPFLLVLGIIVFFLRKRKGNTIVKEEKSPENIQKNG